jgi:hypothetical protein
MAYGVRYIITFYSRADIRYTVHLLLKDYTGTSPVLDGGPDPFILNYQSGDDDIINPIRASEATINFYNDGSTPLSTFYNEDSEAWQVNYYHYLSGQLLWTGFIVQDDCRETFIDPPYLVTLKATDNLALLKDIPFDEGYKTADFKTLVRLSTADVTITGLNTIAIPQPSGTIDMPVSDYQLLIYDGNRYTIIDADFNSSTVILTLIIKESFPANGTFPGMHYEIYKFDSPLAKLSLFTYIQTALINTGLLLPFEIYSNIYENTEQDRTDSATANTFAQSRLHSNIFQDDGGKWQNLYEIIESILMPLNSTLMQSGGKWRIIRWPELKLFNNAIPGTAYNADFSTPAAVTLAPNFPIAIDGNNFFINADATRSILRPFKSVENNFKYNDVVLLFGTDLKTSGDILNTFPSGVFRNDDYEIPPFWKHTHGDTSTIRVITDTSQTPEKEVDRYVVTPGVPPDTQRGVRLNDVEVSKGSKINFSLQFKMDIDDALTLQFWVRINLICTDGTLYTIVQNPGEQPRFNGAFPVANWDLGFGYYLEIPASTPKTEYFQFSFDAILGAEAELPVIPKDGVLAIEVRGTHGTSSGSSNWQLTVWNQVKLEIISRVNERDDTTGHRHKTEYNEKVKSKLEQEILIDDTSKNNIPGTLFTSAITAFDADVGDKYFTRTSAWHRGALTETRRLGDITTLERQQMQATARTIIEGSIKFTDLISLLNVIQIDTLPNLNFIMGVTEINFMEQIFQVTLWEIYQTGEADISAAYSFNYIYKET